MKICFYLLIIPFSIILASCDRPTDSGSEFDNVPPAVPSGLRVYMATDGEVVIDWRDNSEPDLAGYNIYRSLENGTFEKVFFTDNDYYYDDSLDYTTRYIYKVTAVDDGGFESSPTDTISAEPVNRYVPDEPSGLQINARNWQGEKSIFIKWDPNTETDIEGYNIYRGENEKGMISR